MLYFFDANGRYLGRRERMTDEAIPVMATEVPVDVPPNKEAFFTDGQWRVSDIPEAQVPSPNSERTPEERLLELEQVAYNQGLTLDQILDVLEAIV